MVTGPLVKLLVQCEDIITVKADIVTDCWLDFIFFHNLIVLWLLISFLCVQFVLKNSNVIAHVSGNFGLPGQFSFFRVAEMLIFSRSQQNPRCTGRSPISA